MLWTEPEPALGGYSPDLARWKHPSGWAGGCWGEQPCSGSERLIQRWTSAGPTPVYTAAQMGHWGLQDPSMKKRKKSFSINKPH